MTNRRRFITIAVIVLVIILIGLGLYRFVIGPRIDEVFAGLVPTYDTFTAARDSGGGITVTLRRGQDYPYDIPHTLTDMPSRFEGDTFTLLLPESLGGERSACFSQNGTICEFYALFPLGPLQPGYYVIRLEGAGEERWALSRNLLYVTETEVSVLYALATPEPTSTVDAE